MIDLPTDYQPTDEKIDGVEALGYATPEKISLPGSRGRISANWQSV